MVLARPSGPIWSVRSSNSYKTNMANVMILGDSAKAKLSSLSVKNSGKGKRYSQNKIIKGNIDRGSDYEL